MSKRILPRQRFLQERDFDKQGPKHINWWLERAPDGYCDCEHKPQQHRKEGRRIYKCTVKDCGCTVHAGKLGKKNPNV